LNAINSSEVIRPATAEPISQSSGAPGFDNSTPIAMSTTKVDKRKAFTRQIRAAHSEQTGRANAAIIL